MIKPMQKIQKNIINYKIVKCKNFEKEGNEYSCECISYKGKHTFLAFTKKYTTGSPNFIETGHVQPADIDVKFHEKIKKEIFKALSALEITDGASHTEFKVDEDGNCRIIEIGARMGGDCIGSDLVKISTGMDFVKMVIDVACNKKPNFEKVQEPQKAEIKFIFSKEDMDEFEKYSKENSQKLYRVSEFNKENFSNVTDSSNRVGYYIIKG